MIEGFNEYIPKKDEIEEAEKTMSLEQKDKSAGREKEIELKKYNELSDMMLSYYSRFKNSFDSENYIYNVESFKKRMKKKGIDINEYELSKILLHPKVDTYYIKNDTENGDIEKFIRQTCLNQEYEEAA
jgi:hypothetical protein